LKSAGWHFEDSDLSVSLVQERRQVLDRIAGDLTGKLTAHDAIRLALVLEDGGAQRQYIAAATPQDSTMGVPLHAATPPAPSLQLLLERIRLVKAHYRGAQIGADLDRLGSRLSSESVPQSEDVA
jgi:hypothetical protein